ncbi:MAG TPA: septum formation family protein, partial [Streptomyces sp.]
LALVRISRSKEGGRGLAIAGLVLSVVWLGAGLVAVVPKLLAHASAGPDYIHTMAVGECLNSSADGEHVTRIPCDRPHDEQIVKRVDVSSGYEIYPGLATLREPALASCQIAAAAYFTEGTPPPSLQFMVHLPTQDSWDDGVREATCTFRQLSGQLTASVPR